MGVMTRREVIKVSGLAAAAGWLGFGPATLLGGMGAGQPGAGSAGGAAGRKRVLRVAHLTDLHIQPEKRAGEGVAACLGFLAKLDPRPDLILTGGDLIMDSFAADDARTRLQWELLTKTLRDHAPCPVEHTLGNHDIWGWNKSGSKTTGQEPLWGKQRAIQTLGLSGAYRSFDRGGWHFVVLDSVQPEGDGYLGYLDDAQWDWLQKDLKAVPKGRPTLVVSHIPIFSATSILNGGGGDKPTTIGYSVMHRDSARVHALMAAHNVKLALSGHTHQLDRVEYAGVTYVCDGAVSGAWWDGKKDRCDEGFGVFDLYEDGGHEHTYVTYGWRAGA